MELSPNAVSEENYMAEMIGHSRYKLLLQSDWAHSKFDRPSANREEWFVYRQALRDVPSQEGFPHNIIWPTKPE